MEGTSTITTTTHHELPGFRFHPTEEELLEFYLKNIVYTKKVCFDVIGLLNIYLHEPWDLPALAKTTGEREWYFLVPRDRKQGSGGRPNRTTETGFWKATGSDRRIFSLSDQKKIIGLRKTLVFYKGRAPRGSKTDWVMNEYRLPDSTPIPKDIVLCKIYRKATSLKVLEQRAAKEDETKAMLAYNESSPLFDPIISLIDTISFCNNEHPQINKLVFKTEEEQQMGASDEDTNNGLAVHSSASSVKLPSGHHFVTELQVPRISMDWTHEDPFWSPWLQNLTPSYASILNLI